METGLVLTIPNADPVVDGWRQRFDPGAAAGMPAHVTLIYPFRELERLDAGDRERLARVIADFRPFELSFSSVRRFEDEGILWLAPEPADLIDQLMTSIVAAFPEHPPFGGRFETVIPHLTVAHADPETLTGIEKALASVQIRQKIWAVSLFGRTDDGWRELERFALGPSRGAG